MFPIMTAAPAVLDLGKAGEDAECKGGRMNANMIVLLGALSVLACEASTATPGSAAPMSPTTTATGEAASSASGTVTKGGAVDGGQDHGFAAAFAKESRDAGWAAPEEGRLRNAVATIQGANLESVECKTTVCRLEFTFADRLAALRFDHDMRRVRREVGHRARGTTW